MTLHTYTHLGKTWTFGADKLCCGLLHAFEVKYELSWYVHVQTIKYSPLNSRIRREFCIVTDFLNLLFLLARIVVLLPMDVCRVLTPPRLNKLPYMDKIKQGLPLFFCIRFFHRQQICNYICNKLALESSNGAYTGGVAGVCCCVVYHCTESSVCHT